MPAIRAVVTLWLTVVLRLGALGADLSFVGNAYYSVSSNTVVLQADQLVNNDSSGISGTVRLDLWAFSSPFSGSGSGYDLASYVLGQLPGGYVIQNINSGSINFALPPPGTWYLSLLAREYTGTGADGYTTRAWYDFSYSERVAGGAFWQDEEILGPASWQMLGSTVNIQAQEIASACDLGTSENLRLNLWATTTPYGGGTMTGYSFGTLSLDPLTGGDYYLNINQDVTYIAPPDGYYYVTLTLEEFNNGSWVIVDYNNYSGLQTFGNPAPFAPATDPATGIATNGFVANWEPAFGALGYRLDVSTSAVFTTFVSGYQNLDVGSTTSQPVTGLRAGVIYYYRVRAYNSGGTSAQSDTRTASPIIPRGLTIIPIFDATITTDPDAATIEATINAAIATYRTNFTDPVIVCITFAEDTSISLARSLYNSDAFVYSDYIAALASHATSSDDTTALAGLPNQAVNPVNGSPYVDLQLPLARALGFSADPVPGQTDSTITLNTPKMNLSPASTDPAKYSLFAAVCHEINESLGLGSALNGLNNGDPAPGGGISPEDLFRYDQNGVRSLTTDFNATSYFSLDGLNFLAQFNQDQNGDFGDWYSPGSQTPEVQDAFAVAGANPTLGVELRVLDVIGYTRAGSVCRATVSVAASPPEGGSVGGGTMVACGTSVRVSALASPGFTFQNWTENGNIVSSSSTYTFNATGIRSLVANFGPSSFTISVAASPPGAGKVTGAGTFQPGSQQMVNATPSSTAYVFANWTEDGVVVSTSSGYAFELDNNRNLVANFLANPFVATAGIYNGLFSDTVNGVGQNSSGSITLSVNPKGIFTGALSLRGIRYPLSGQFDSTGSATTTTPPRSTFPLTVSLQLDFFQGTDHMTGSVSTGDWRAQVDADRAVYDGKTTTAPQAHSYTIIFPGNYSSTNLPGGDGFGTVTVDTAGRIKLSATLGDGTKINQTSRVSKNGQWPFYVPLYNGAGSMWGWLTFASASTNDLGGAVSWIKPILFSSKFYPDGFRAHLMASGSKYVPPALAFANGIVMLSGGDLAQSISDAITLGANGVAGNLGNNKLTLIFNAATGLFKGSMANPAAFMQKPVSFNGVAFQKLNMARGCFLEGGQSGLVTITGR